MTSADIATTILSSTAIVISFFGLGWQILRARWERPVVVVTGMRVLLEVGGKQVPHLRINVSNVGDRAVTLLEIGWVTHRGDKSASWTGFPDAAAGLPTRIEPQDHRTWQTSTSTGSGNVDEPFARIVQRPTWREQRHGIGPERYVYGTLGGTFAPLSMSKKRTAPRAATNRSRSARGGR